MLSRRAFVGRLAAGAAGAVAGLVAAGTRSNVAAARGTLSPEPDRAPRPAPEAVPASPISAAPWELLRPLQVGSPVAYGWRVADFIGAIDGSCVLTLRNARPHAYRIHLCRNNGRPQGLVYTDRLDLVVMNGGRGGLPTEEGFAQAVAAVAHVLATNEREQRQAPVMAALLPHAERLRRFATTGDAQLR